MENLAASLLANVSVSDETLFSSIRSTPDLSFVKTPEKTSEDESAQDLSFREITEKASLLHVLEAVVACYADQKSVHQAVCKDFLADMNAKNSLKTILGQFKSYKYIVIPETILMLQTYDFAAMSDDAYVTELVQAAVGAPEYLSVLFGFPILQVMKLGKAYESGCDAVKLPESVIDMLDNELFAPVLLATHLNKNDAEIVTKILYRFDVFDTIVNRWIPAVRRVFGKTAQKVCYGLCHSFVCLFLRLFQRSISMMPRTLSQRLLPLMSVAVQKSPENFQPMINEYNVFSLRHMMDSERFPALLGFAANACSSRKNAEEVLEHFTNKRFTPEPLLKQFFAILRQALACVVSNDVPDVAKWAMYLLKRMCKHLSACHLKRLIEGFDQQDPVAAFSNFLWNFLGNQELGKYAAQCLQYVAVYYPKEVCEFVNSWDFSVIANYMNMSSQVATAFAKIARVFLNNYCALNSQFTVLPSFVSFIVEKYFADAMFQKYDRRSKRWKTLFALLETGYDMCLFDKKFCSEVQNNSHFCGCLISIVQQTASIIGKPPHETKENEFLRLDSDKPTAIIQFDCLAIVFMCHLVEYNLVTENKLSKLSESFFTVDSEASTMFSTLVSFLELTHPLTASMRESSLKFLEILCEVASRMKGVSVDAFYPRQKQAVLTEYVRTNLFQSQDVSQVVTAVDFLSNTLVTQTTFAFAFVRQFGSSFLVEYTQKLDEIGSELPELLLASSKLLSHMFARLSSTSHTLTMITSKPGFWTNVSQIIHKETTNLDIIASKAYLLHCWILGEQAVTEDMVRSVVTQIRNALPAARDPVVLDVNIDLRDFVSVNVYRKYGPMFYIDHELVTRYLINVQQNELIEHIKQANQDLSMIDACTQLISALLTTIKSSNGIRVPVSSISPIISRAFKNDLLPDSTAKLLFELLDFALETDSRSFVVTKNDIQTLGYLVEQRPTDYAFKVIAKYVAASRVGANLGKLLELIEHTADYGVKHVSKNAICCASEVALKLTNYNGWIQHTPIVCSSFEHLIGTDIGVDVVDLFTTICANEENANWLDSQGFFSLLNNLPCDDKCDSELWPHIFNFMAAMPKHSRIPGLFLGNHFSRVSFFLSPDAKAAMTPAKAFKAQLAITDLLAHITLYSHEFFEENPAIFDSIQEKIYMKMEHSVKYLRETPYVELEGTLGSIDTYSEKLCNLCMLRNCLVFMNRRYDFPLGEICKVVTESHTNQFPLEEALEKALEVLHQALKSNDPAFAPVIVQTFELALRIITGAIYKVVGTVPTREKRNSVLRSIKQMSDGLSKTTNVDSQPVQEFFDAVSTFLANL